MKTEIEHLQAKSTALGPLVERLDTLGFGESELETLAAKLGSPASLYLLHEISFCYLD